ncbi:MAG: helix-turn-helix transcriptional regulator [Mycobacteriaceae bacterium]|nr:helix-turn-helix transcriptional regulator [Mycobacteriaceae bacterium]
MSTTADVIRRRRGQLAISQERLGELAGVTQRQIARYESGEQEPSLSTSMRLAEALAISLVELAGLVPQGLDLSGEWWAAWQTWKDDDERVDVHPLSVSQDGEYLQLKGKGARPVADGSYEWRGEMKLWDSEALMGSYRASGGATRSKGTIYFALHPHGTHAVGSWTGQSYAGIIVRGWGALARSRGHAERLIEGLIRTEGTLESWPTTS